MSVQIDSAPVADAFQRAAGTILARIDIALAQTRVMIARDAVALAPKADGTLIRNIKQSRLAELLHTITSEAPHARWIEQGTGTLGPERRASGNRMLSTAGVAALAQWIQRKGILPRSPGVTVEALPWLIARKIALTGTRPQPYMEPAATKNVSGNRERIAAAINQGLREAGLAAAA